MWAILIPDDPKPHVQTEGWSIMSILIYGHEHSYVPKVRTNNDLGFGHHWFPFGGGNIIICTPTDYDVKHYLEYFVVEICYHYYRYY